MSDANNPPSGGPPGGPPTVSPSLLVRLRGRDPDAWRRLIGLYGPVVYRWCRRAGLGEEDAADVGQDVFQSVASGLDGFRRERPGDTFTGWLRMIARNKIRDHWRRRAGRPAAAGGTDALLRLNQAPGEPDPDCLADTACGDDGSLYRDALERVRSEFEDRTWRAFLGVTAEGRPVADVARELGMTPGAVYVAKSRVLRRFRDEFGDLIG